MQRPVRGDLAAVVQERVTTRTDPATTARPCTGHRPPVRRELSRSGIRAPIDPCTDVRGTGDARRRADPEPEAASRRVGGGWAALAAVYAARGWGDDIRATPEQWLYHDGGGNWACLRFAGGRKAVLIGHDHEMSKTSFGGPPGHGLGAETDLLAGAPSWWGSNLEIPELRGDRLGFVYGWNGRRWQRAGYDEEDGFDDVGLVRSCSVSDAGDRSAYLRLYESTEEAFGHAAGPDLKALKALVAADAHITRRLLEPIVPGWDIDAGVAAGREFLSAGRV